MQGLLGTARRTAKQLQQRASFLLALPDTRATTSGFEILMRRLSLPNGACNLEPRHGRDSGRSAGSTHEAKRNRRRTWRVRGAKLLGRGHDPTSSPLNDPSHVALVCNDLLPAALTRATTLRRSPRESKHRSTPAEAIMISVYHGGARGVEGHWRARAGNRCRPVSFDLVMSCVSEMALDTKGAQMCGLTSSTCQIGSPKLPTMEGLAMEATSHLVQSVAA